MVQKLFQKIILGFLIINLILGNIAKADFLDWLFTPKNILAKIKSEKVVPIGYVPWYFPFTYSDTNTPPSGFSLEFSKMLAKVMAEKIGVSILVPKIIPMNINPNFDFGFPSIINREVAFECGTTLDIAEKPQGVIFSKPYFVSSIHVLSKKVQPVTKIDDLRNHLFLAHEGLFLQYLQRTLNDEMKLNVGLLPVGIIQEAGINLDEGKALGVIGDALRVFNLIYALSNPNDYALGVNTLPEVSYVCTMPEGEVELKKVIDESITEVLKSEDYQRLYYRWFLLPTKDLNISLDYPMPKGLQQLIIKSGGNINPELTGIINKK